MQSKARQSKAAANMMCIWIWKQPMAESRGELGSAGGSAVAVSEFLGYIYIM